MTAEQRLVDAYYHLRQIAAHAANLGDQVGSELVGGEQWVAASRQKISKLLEAVSNAAREIPEIRR